MPHIITIGREFGSGGREVGRRLAERLGYAYYDDEIINELIRNTNYSKEYLEEVSEKDPVPLFPIRYGSTLNPTPDAGVSMALDVLSEQAKIMRELALKSDCIIIGRAADYLLRDLHPYRIFVFATLESRLARTKGREKSGKSDKELLKSRKRIDKQRKKYYRFVTGKDWGDWTNYDLLVNTSFSDIKWVVDFIAHLFERQKQEKETAKAKSK